MPVRPSSDKCALSPAASRMNSISSSGTLVGELDQSRQRHRRHGRRGGASEPVVPEHRDAVAAPSARCGCGRGRSPRVRSRAGFRQHFDVQRIVRFLDCDLDRLGAARGPPAGAAAPPLCSTCSPASGSPATAPIAAAARSPTMPVPGMPDPHAVLVDVGAGPHRYPLGNRGPAGAALARWPARPRSARCTRARARRAGAAAGYTHSTGDLLVFRSCSMRWPDQVDSLCRPPR